MSNKAEQTDNREVSKVASIGAIILTITSMIILYCLTSENTSGAMKDYAINNMETAINIQTGIINQFVINSETLLKQYGNSDEIINLLENPTNPEYIESAQRYTERFYEDLNDWEGIYVSNWDTKVLAHSDINKVGMVTRSKDELTQYRDTMLTSDNGLYNEGAFKSPASGKLILNLRMVIYNKNGEPIGLIGGGPYLYSLSNIIDKYKVSGLDNATYCIIDLTDKIYILNNNEELIAREIEDKNILKIISNIENNIKTNRNAIVYRNDNGEHTMIYSVIPEYNWVLIMNDTANEIFAANEAIKVRLLITCVVVCIIIAAFLYMLSKWIVKPFSMDKSVIERLRELDDIS